MSANVTLKSIHCPLKEADHRNGPGQLTKERGLARNSLQREREGQGRTLEKGN